MAEAEARWLAVSDDEVVLEIDDGEDDDLVSQKPALTEDEVMGFFEEGDSSDAEYSEADDGDKDFQTLDKENLIWMESSDYYNYSGPDARLEGLALVDDESGPSDKFENREKELRDVQNSVLELRGFSESLKNEHELLLHQIEDTLAQIKATKRSSKKSSEGLEVRTLSDKAAEQIRLAYIWPKRDIFQQPDRPPVGTIQRCLLKEGTAVVREKMGDFNWFYSTEPC